MDPLDWVMASIALCGTFGLFAIGLAERLVPVMPSYALLLAIGVAAGDGIWLLQLALLTITLGGIVGCAASLYSLRLIGAARSERILHKAGRFLSLSDERRDRMRQAYRRNHTTLAFSLQLVPTVRLVTPILAVLAGGSVRSFLAASALGILAWNALFVGVGYVASNSGANANTTILAGVVLVCVILGQIVIATLARTLGKAECIHRPHEAVEVSTHRPAASGGVSDVVAQCRQSGC